MHLYTIAVYAILFWSAGEPSPWRLVTAHDRAFTLLAVVGQPMMVGLAAWLFSRRTLRLLSQADADGDRAVRFYHRSTLTLRLFLVVGFAAGVLLTNWPQWFRFGTTAAALQIVGDCIVLTPFVVGLLAMWLATFPVERRLRAWSTLPADSGIGPPPLRLPAYLAFNIRHHFLVVALPMTLILFAANMLQAHDRQLQGWTGWFWTSDALLGATAVAVFVISPLMLRRVWKTTPLADGPLRTRLEDLCRRIGLQVREILVWHSDGHLINAAVMGVIPGLRYVLLSDGLLATMDARQIEAVFGHEAGHVRRHHMQHFLVFAFVGWLLVVGLMELLARQAMELGGSERLSSFSIQGIGAAATAVFWLVGFGWLSRRFEREADLFGARCVAADGDSCWLPCGFHAEGGTRAGALCATGSAVFASALDRVALLNGIPHEERSWRHSSIASRIRFLRGLAGDPIRVARFERLVRCAKRLLVALAVIGAAATAYYCVAVPRPAILRLSFERP